MLIPSPWLHLHFMFVYLPTVPQDFFWAPKEMSFVHVEYMDYVYGASRVLTVFISVAGPYGGGRLVDPLISLIGTTCSFIETGAFYYCIRVGRYWNSFWLVRSLRPGVSREIMP
jgi:hypothetical protein